MVSQVARVAATMNADGGAKRGEWVKMGCAKVKKGCTKAEMN